MIWTTRIALTISMVLVWLATTIAGEPQGNLMTPKREKVYRNILPKVANKHIQKILDDPNTIYYTDTEIPKAHQDWEGALQGIHSPFYNISAVPTEPFGNTNREFPWGAPFGTHQSPSSKSFRFLHLPTQENGKRWPVTWWYMKPLRDPRVATQSNYSYSWIFPKGTTIGEVLYLNDSEGYSYVYELRVRKRGLKKWTVNVFRPFPTAKDLSAAIKGFWPQYANDKGLAKLVAHLEAPLAKDVHTLRSKHPDKLSFKQYRKIDTLPPITEEQVTKLLGETTFTSALGVDWKPGKYAPHAPTTNAKFHVVPKGYTGGFVAINSKSCMQCHETCNHHARDFDFNRDWYGRVRGSDGIFSFHPFSKSSISHSGTPRQVAISPVMVRKGIVARWSKKSHPNTVYHQVTGLR